MVSALGMFTILFAIYLVLKPLQTLVIEDEYTHASVAILNCSIDISGHTYLCTRWSNYLYLSSLPTAKLDLFTTQQ